ncbi:hypothetical protein AJ80_01306 [Polytolypa hystricis UAMH7299]|uniref:Alcohol dehydrogenase-like C-terminal domain-containing protein n=1 Tax=Polytolypa hystricis (strain UAMH7299) TaxID=1447883 RepID=A0A2B7Z004_POLH7|nr:hypothetical protein AJ80_01306 [Polytolypa hystricis UAMH7299]
MLGELTLKLLSLIGLAIVPREIGSSNGPSLPHITDNLTIPKSGEVIAVGFSGDLYIQERRPGWIREFVPRLLPVSRLQGTLHALQVRPVQHARMRRSALPSSCAGITAFHATIAANIEKGDWRGVVGCGGLGQLAIKYAKAKGYEVIGVDIDDNTLETAKSSGADHVFSSRSNPDFISEIKKITASDDGDGVDAVAVFVAAKPGYEAAKKMVKIGANLIVLGIPKQNLEFPAFELTTGTYKVVGANNSANLKQLAPCAEFTAKHGIHSPAKWYKLEQINEMIQMMQKEAMAGNRLAVSFDE